VTTATDIENALNEVAADLDLVLPLAGQAELVPLVNIVTALATKLTEAIASKAAAAPTLAAEVLAADAAADIAEKAKLGEK
jgi:hypothetical protein